MLIYPVIKQIEEIWSVESLVNERCRHGGAVVITVATQQGGCGFNPGLRLRGFTPAFSHSPKTYVLNEFGTQICLWDLEWYLFFIFLCGPGQRFGADRYRASSMNGRLVSGVPFPDTWDRPQQTPVVLSAGGSWYRKWMDGNTLFLVFPFPVLSFFVFFVFFFN